MKFSPNLEFFSAESGMSGGSVWDECLIGDVDTRNRGDPRHANTIQTEAPLILVALGRSHMPLFRDALIAASAAAAQPTPASPASTAGKAYVGVFKDDAVAVIDTTSNRVIRTIPVPKGPHGLVMTPDGRKVYVSSDGASTVSVIDTISDQVVSSIDVGPNPHGLAMSPDGRKLLVMAFGANQAMVIDTTSDRILGQIPVPLAHNGAISSDGRTAYVGSQQQGATAIAVLDLTEMKEIAKVSLDKTPRGLDLSPDGKWLYFTVAGSDAVLGARYGDEPDCRPDCHRAPRLTSPCLPQTARSR